MALPPTGSQITMTEVRNYFGASGTPIVMSVLGSYLGISVGSTIFLSATFGGLTTSGNNWIVSSLVPGGGLTNKPVPYLYTGTSASYNAQWVDGGSKLAVAWQSSSGSEMTAIWNIPNPYDLTSLVGDGVPDIYIDEPTNKGGNQIDFNSDGTKVLTQHNTTLGFGIEGAIIRTCTTPFDTSTASATPDETFTDQQRSSGYSGRNGIAWRDGGYMFCYMGEKSTGECSWEIYRTVPGGTPYTFAGLYDGGFPNLEGLVDNTSTSFYRGGFADDGFHFWGYYIAGKTMDMKTHSGTAWFDWKPSSTTTQTGGPDLPTYGRIAPVAFAPNGTQLVAGGPGTYNGYITAYELSTAWDLSTWSTKTTKPNRHSGAHLSLWHFDDQAELQYTGLNATNSNLMEGGVCWNLNGTSFLSIINREYIEQDMPTAYDFSSINSSQASGSWAHTAAMPFYFSSSTPQNVMSMKMHPQSSIGISQVINYNGTYVLMYRRLNSAGTIANGVSNSYASRTIGSTVTTDFQVQHFQAYSPSTLPTYPYIYHAYLQWSTTAQTLIFSRGTSSVISSPSAASFYSSLNLSNMTGKASASYFARCFAMSPEGDKVWVAYNARYTQTRLVDRAIIYEISLPTPFRSNSASITGTFTLPWYISAVTGMDVNSTGTAMILRDQAGYVHSYEIP